MMLKVKEKALKIIGSDKGANYLNLYNRLNNRQTEISSTITSEYIESFEKPAITNNRVRFNYTKTEIEKIISKYGILSENEVDEIWLLALSLCGVNIINESARQYVNVPKEKSNRYLRLIATINEKPFTMRVVPNCWGGEESMYSTIFNVTDASVCIGEDKLFEFTSWCNFCSIENIAYISKNLKKEHIICVNPLQYCNQECKFCLRTQELYSSEKNNTLVHLDPSQLCRYIDSELSGIDYSKLNEFYISTARFNSSEHILDYLKNLYTELLILSNNLFDPLSNDNQWLKVSTHLLDTVEYMKEAKEYGMKKYIYPIEIVSNHKRKEYMVNEKLDNNKGDVTFEEIITILNKASDIFGKENIEPVLIIGIDTYEDTMYALKRLKENGYDTLTYNVFRIYYEAHIELYGMNVEEIIDVIMYIKRNFNAGYKQVIDMKNKHVQKSYFAVK